MPQDTIQRWADAVAGMGDKPHHWLFYYDYLFRDVDFVGKTVLDIGGGVGRSAYYAAARGASEVVCVEPEADGSHHHMLARAAAIGKRAGLDHIVKFVTKPIQEAKFDQQFDIVMSLNAINHLDEEACINIRHDVEARAKYISLLADVGNLCKDGGTLLITDCSNENLSHVVVGSLESAYRNIFRKKERLGWYFNPVARDIEYWKHQSPELWAELLSYAGFKDPVIRWTPDRRSGKFGEKYLTSRFASWCLQSHFVMTMKKNTTPA